MESADFNPGDFSVGSIVWVRRRNGSWWPGKIVGPEELSTSHLTSPRSGTPVKLLGREDASVDWYNLEKSKRVKAFRCGDFDDCIQKAESAQGMPPKKREKYARREDAILHALELEREQLKNEEKLDIMSECITSKLSGAVKRDVISSESLGNDIFKLGNSISHQIYKRKDSSNKTAIIGTPLLSSQRAKEGNQLSGEDDHSDATPRMRGLQDFGLKIAPSKRKFSPSAALNGSWEPTVDGIVQAHDHDSLSLGGASHTNGAEQTGVICRAKRSKCVYLPAESFDSLEYEAGPSPVGYRLHGPLIEDDTSGFTEGEAECSETECSDPEYDSSETEPNMDEEMQLLSDPEVGRYETQDQRGLVGEEPYESTHSGDTSHLYTRDPFFASEAVSKWQLKGKRNTRNLTKRLMDPTDGRGYFYGPYSEEKAEMSGPDDGYPLMSRATSKRQNRGGRNITDWDDGSWEDRSAWEDWCQRGRFDQVYDDHFPHSRTSRFLIEADLKVQASYQKEPVPIVSLMSKLDGKAIIGHPIQVEALENGTSNTFLTTNDDSGDEAIDNEGGTTLPHAWRTARRTANVRVPRPHLFSTLDGDDTADDISFPGEGTPFQKSRHKASQVKRNQSHNSRLPSDRKFPKKVSKKVSLSTSQKTKTRTLSSIAIEQKFGTKATKRHYSSSKPVSSGSGSGSTARACIPVKLVFSRLLEKINRPPSKSTPAPAPAPAPAAGNTVLLNGDVDRKS